MKSGFVTVIGILLLSAMAHARPEYAVKQNAACMACHANPWGGGPKTTYGKMYGSRDFGVSKFTLNEMFDANLRGIAYFPKYPTKTASGVALMEASGSVNAAVIEESEKSSELRAVLTYNASPLGSGLREGYMRFKPNWSAGPAPTYFMVGRFNSPFGLLTDEHRTYTRLQTNMTLNNFETGFAASGALIPSLYYDLAVVNDFGQAGSMFTTKDLTWGAILNFRWSPDFLPFFLGISGNYLQTLNASQPFATSFYAALSLDRLTKNKVTATLLGECVIGRYWDNVAYNSSISSFFVPSTDATYQSAIVGSQSIGYYALAKYDLGQRWSVFAKFDYLDLDSSYPSDAFFRYGLGVEIFLNSNLILNTRLEHAFVGRPELAEGTAFAAQDDLIAMLRLWL